MTTLPPPRQSSRDVSWSVMFRLGGTGVWAEWSNGHRSPGEAVDWAEPLKANPAVADIRFDRITRTRDMFDLHGIAQAGEGS
ncbi:hypothetical protein [Actinacidiphila sp. ITFR-21]|uniref:hypothetical protein n=1 Tax=Actinacidiphila sp. ITFR-21 TaxID=3075199 RepID=UPI002889224B|nr:hypothetical protein [Streptomyces sp. ITFR-21]WNI19216.1 hypothetical protein RLT57_29175 [Streptomyces sp. ITFR-21]